MEIRKKIFLTGISGFLGSQVALKLSKQGHHVIGLIRGDESPSLLKGHSIEYCKGNILNPESYDSALKECDVVVHTAAITSFGMKRTQDYYETNTEGTKILLKCSQAIGIERFIHTSTRGTLGVADMPEQSDETYGNKQTDGMDDYIKSKYLAELEVIKCSQNGAMVCCILSPTALVGACDQKPTPVGRIILSFLRGKVFVYMNGGINLIDVEDVAQVFVEALEKGENGQIYILGNENITLFGLFRELSMISGIPLPKIKIPFQVAYTTSAMINGLSKVTGGSSFVTPAKIRSSYKRHSYCSSQKAIQAFGLSQAPIKVALTKAINWYRYHSNLL